MARKRHLFSLMIAGMLAVACVQSLFASESRVRIWEEDVVMPSYRLDPSDKNAMFYKNESYQGAQKRIYPYAFQEHVTGVREDRPFRFVFLENEFIKLSVLPEIGGRLFSATDKTNGYEIFYRQNVIKPALIGMLGAWISGGVEWCVFHHHRNTTHMPVDYTLVENEDGSKTIWFGETERRQRMKWLIGLTLYPDRSYIEATVKLSNRTALPHSMLYWANVAVHVNDDYQVIFPPSVQYATYHAKNDFAHWPIAAESYQGVDYSGVDLSWWKNHPEPVSFFAWNLQEDFMGGYDHGQKAGVVHVGNHEIVSGAKLWEWSPGPRGRMWDKILTDTDGPYAELMVGAYSDNQPDYSWIQPGEVRTFKQYWYPIREIGGFKKANLEAAVNLTLEDGSARIGFNTTREHSKARMVLRRGSEILLDREVGIGPESPVITRVPLGGGVKETELIAELFDGEGSLLVRYQPTERVYDPSLPERVVPPPAPEEIESQEALYLTGLRVQQINNPSIDPNAYFREAVKRDPGDSRSNTMLGINLLRRGLYEEAEGHLKRAVERLSEAYTRPRNAEALFYLAQAQRAQGRLDEAHENYYRASWDAAFFSAAHLEIAELDASRGNLESALDELNQSLSTNARDNRARGFKAAVLRRLGRTGEARAEVAGVLADDPLDFLSRNEAVLLAGAIGAESEAQTLLRLMRDDVQNYLELAADYSRLGLWDDAAGVLSRGIEGGVRSVAEYPMSRYFLGYLQSKMGLAEVAKVSYAAASKLPFDYGFPFRKEMEKVLHSAIDSNASDARAYLYLGNLLFEDQPQKAISYWEKARDLDGRLAPVHRNLGWAYYRVEQDVDKAVKSYEQAVAVDGTDPRVLLELDELYEVSNTDPEKRRDVLRAREAVVASRNYSALREIMVDVLVGDYDRALRSLTENQFHVREGGGEIHDVYVDAHLLKGWAALESGEPSAAVAHFREAAKYPENLSVGVPRRDRRATQVAYSTGAGLEASGDRDAARAEFEKAAGVELPSSWFEARFYQALALEKLGRSSEAVEIFKSLVQEGKRRIESRPEIDFFAKFGEQQTELARQAEGHFLRGLGFWGQGDKASAAAEFEESVRRNRANVWARYYWNESR